MSEVERLHEGLAEGFLMRPEAWVTARAMAIGRVAAMAGRLAGNDDLECPQ